MSQCWMRRSEWPRKVAPETIDGGRATMQITIELPEDIAVGLESKWQDLPRAAARKPGARGISVACPDRCAGSAAPRFQDADASRRLSQRARNLRLLGRGFRTGIARLFGSSERERLGPELGLSMVVGADIESPGRGSRITPGASRPIWRAPHRRRDQDRWLVRESRLS